MNAFMSSTFLVVEQIHAHDPGGGEEVDLQLSCPISCITVHEGHSYASN